MKKISVWQVLCWLFIVGVSITLWWQYVGFPVKMVTDLPYGAGNRPQSPKLDLYLPQGVIGPRPLIVYIHGGSWWSGDKANPPFQSLIRHGFAGASIDYRLSNQAKFPAQLDDCKEAIRWLRRHSQEYNIDPRRIGVWGTSSGGHLAALVALKGEGKKTGDLADSSEVQAACDFCGISDLSALSKPPAGSHNWRIPLAKPMKALLGATPEAQPELYKQASPISYVHPGAPPFFIVHGKDDDLVPPQQSIDLHQALEQNKVPSKLLLLDGTSHWIFPDSAFEKAEAFFAQTLGYF